jgi:hypothetical protein
MKPKKVSKKLNFKKVTVSSLNNGQLDGVKGGTYVTSDPMLLCEDTACTCDYSCPICGTGPNLTATCNITCRNTCGNTCDATCTTCDPRFSNCAPTGDPYILCQM